MRRDFSSGDLDFSARPGKRDLDGATSWGIILAAGTLVVSSRLHAGGRDDIRGKEAHFESRVRPLLVARCVRCHGAGKVKGGLRLDAPGIAALR